MTVFFKVKRGARKNRSYNKGYDTANKKEYYALEIDSIMEKV